MVTLLGKCPTHVTLFTVTCYLFFTVSGSSCAYGALEAEAAVEQPGRTTGVPLKTLNLHTDEKNTVFDYLTEVEVELLDFDKRNLLAREMLMPHYTLDDCLAVAIRRHLPIEITRDKVSLYRRKLVKAIRDLFPAMDILLYEHNVGWKLLKNDTNPGDNSNQRFRSEKWRINLTHTIFSGGALWNKVNEERASLRGAQAEYDKVFLDLSIEVARGYFHYSKAQTMLSYKEELLAKANKELAISEEKMKAALISEIEHLNVQSQQSQIQHDLEAAREDIALALVDLQKTLHLDVSEPVEIPLLNEAYIDTAKKEMEKEGAQAERTAAAQEEELDKYLDIAYEQRPEFIIQKSKVDASLYREKVAMAGWFPQARLSVQRGQKAEAYREDDNNPPWDMEHRYIFDVRWNVAGSTVRYMYDKNRQGVGVEATERGAGIGDDGYYDRTNSISFSFLDGLDQFVNTKEAEIGRKESLLELELSEKDIVSEVKEAYYNYNRSLIQLKSVFKRLAYRQKLVELAKHRSEINEIQISEYLQAEIDLINEWNNVYKAMVDFFLAKISLNKSIGIKEYPDMVLSSRTIEGINN